MRIDPTNWYVGMKDPSMQLMIYGKDVRNVKTSLLTTPMRESTPLYASTRPTISSCTSISAEPRPER